LLQIGFILNTVNQACATYWEFSFSTFLYSKVANLRTPTQK